MQRTDLITLKQKSNCSISILTKPLPQRERERDIDTDTHREKEREGRRGREGCRGKKETPLSVAITFSRGGAFLGG